MRNAMPPPHSSSFNGNDLSVLRNAVLPIVRASMPEWSVACRHVRRWWEEGPSCGPVEEAWHAMEARRYEMCISVLFKCPVAVKAVAGK